MTATDSSSNTSDLAVTVTVTDVDDTDPVISNSVSTSTPSIEENQTFVATFNSDEPVTW